MFWRRAKAAGLEIDSGCVRAAQLEPKRFETRLRTVGLEDISDDAVVAGVVEDPDEVAEALMRLWSANSFSTRDVVLGVANQGMFMRSITFPHVERENLADALELSADDYLPISTDKLIMDFAVLDEIVDEEGNEAYQLLLVAVRKEQIQRSLDAIQNAGLNPISVDASPLALIRNIPSEEIQETMLLADIGNGVSSLLVSADGLPVFARVSPVALYSLFEQLEANGESEIDSSVSQLDLRVPEKFPEQFQAWARELAQEINTSVNYFLSRNDSQTIETLQLTGRGCHFAKLREILQEELAIEVQCVNPFDDLAASAKTDSDLNIAGAEYAVCVGLARRAIEEEG